MSNKYLNLLKMTSFVGIVILTSILLNLCRPFMPFGKNINRLFLEGGALAVIFSSYYLFMTKWDKIPFSSLSIYLMKGRLRLLCYGFLLGAVLLTTVFVLNYLFHSIAPTYLNMSVNTCAGIVLFFIATLFTAMWEEISFRGYLLQKLSETIGIHSSCSIIALCFGLLHLLSPLSSYQIVISTFLSGMLLNYAYFYSGNLYLPIGIHFGWNFFNGLLFSERIFKIEYLNRFLSGVKNPEQGLIAILITGLVAIWFVALYLKKQKNVNLTP